jgi:hypothetical protein
LAAGLVGLLLVAGMAFSAMRAHAAVTVTVPCSGSGGGTPGLISAIQKANNQGGGTIILAPHCTYTISSGEFDNGHGSVGLPPIAEEIEIEGKSATIARDQNASEEFRLFEVKDADTAALTIDGVTLKGGVGETGKGGGAVLVLGDGTLTVTGATFVDNTAGVAAAISNFEANTRITHSEFRGNGATDQGGAIGNGFGHLVIDRSIITSNKAKSRGGGILNQGAAKVLRTTISGNELFAGENTGGGIFNVGELRVRRSTISGNVAGGFGATGGGITNFRNEALWPNSLKVTDSTISGNVAGDPGTPEVAGGGIWSNGTAEVAASTIADNRLGDGTLGGGIAAVEPLTVTSSIVARNSRDNCAGSVEDGGFNLENGTSCGFTNNAVNAPPQLAPLADNGGPTQTHAIKADSPAIDWVSPSMPFCGPVDQRGVSRPQGPRCDIGAFELRQQP